MTKERGPRAANGEGSIYRVEGRGYRGYVEINGRRKFFTAASKAEASQKKRELLRRRDQGELQAGRVPTVEQWMEHWLTSISNVRPTTHAMNRWVTEKKIVPSLGKLKISALTTERLDRWVADLAVAPASSRRYLAPLRAALEEASRRGHIGHNPAARVNIAKQQGAKASAFSRDDRDAILAAAEKGNDAARWHIALRLGLRPAEALGLVWDDFDEVAGTLTIQRQLLYAKGVGDYIQRNAKTAAGTRTLQLPRSLVTLLLEHRAQQVQTIQDLGDEWAGFEFDGAPVALMFPMANGKPAIRTDKRAWKNLLEQAGIPFERRYKSRHTAATHMIVDSGGDIAVTAYNMGHGDTGFTYRTYVHPLEAQAVELAKRMDAPRLAAKVAANVTASEPLRATPATRDPSNYAD